MKYQFIETPSANYLQRTEWNVRDSDATIVFTLAPEATGGSLKTIEYAKKHNKPCLHVSRSRGYQPEVAVAEFVTKHAVKALNIAGSRESKEPGLYQWVMKVLNEALFWSDDHPGILGGPGEG